LPLDCTRSRGKGGEGVGCAIANSWQQLGLAAVPFLPFIFDKPVEQAVEWGFHKGLETIWGPEAVRQRPVTGRIEELQAESKKAAGKEKEL